MHRSNDAKCLSFIDIQILESIHQIKNDLWNVEFFQFRDIIDGTYEKKYSKTAFYAIKKKEKKYCLWSIKSNTKLRPFILTLIDTS